MRYLVLTFVLALAGGAHALAANTTCSLLTKPEAAKFLGTPIAVVKPESGQGSNDCRYLNANHSQNVFITVDRSGDAAQQLGMMGAAHAQPVPGLGVKAYFMGGTLYAFKGNAVLTVAIYKNENSMTAMESGLTALAKTVLSRL